MVLFAIPLVALKRFGVSAPLWLKVAAVSGFVVSVVAGYFTLIPITRVDNPLGFALKIIVVVVAANAIGVALYRLRNRPSRIASE
jgi:type III secretory pathway component EscS